jgi:hypothetical protein
MLSFQATSRPTPVPIKGQRTLKVTDLETYREHHQRMQRLSPGLAPAQHTDRSQSYAEWLGRQPGAEPTPDPQTSYQAVIDDPPEMPGDTA